ncbi:MAG: rRNA adenine N-6-methyltransferase family protein [Paracoccaceae bacterium]
MPQSSTPNDAMDVKCLEQDFQYSHEKNLWTLKKGSGEFAYSDGDESENYMLSVIQSAKDCSVMSDELSAAMKDFPSTYHLHHQRCNLLRPISSDLKGPILEIGAGCGVLTRFLGEQGHQVFALEGSPRRASIIGARCRDLPNVSVIQANFQDFRVFQKFQTITLIGVLEYARLYFSDGGAGDPVDHTLKHVSDMLLPEGALIVAIENQLGLKYFAGYPEDHLSIAMAGVENQYTDKSVVTFGRKTLSEKLSMAGLNHQRFAYPFPDYKFPQAVLFEDAMSGQNAHRYAPLVAGTLASDPQKPRRQNFRMSMAIQPVMQNGLGADLANSFLITASSSQSAISSPTTANVVYYGNCDRKKPYLKEVRIQEDSGVLDVERRAICKNVASDNEEITQVLENEPFVEGTLWASELQKLLIRTKWTLDDLTDWARVWLEALKEEADLEADMNLSPLTKLNGSLLDAIPKNLVINPKGERRFFDLEWHTKKPLELGYLITRGLWASLLEVEYIETSRNEYDITSLIQEVSSRLGFSMSRAEIDAYLVQEAAFQQKVFDKPAPHKKFRYIKTQTSHRSLNRREKRLRNFRRLLHKLQHPVSTFFQR